jgi:AcrR family transcriptional regulator
MLCFPETRTAMDRKPKRRTRERIIETSLSLFNQFGEPNVTTTVISDEMNISPGNLYYHFRNKDEIIEEIFRAFEREIEDTLAAPQQRAPDVEDTWLFLHILFELIWKYRFLYRDLNDLLSRNRTVEIHFRRILDHSVRTATLLCEGMVAVGQMRAERHEIEALATNMVLVSTYWLSYEYVRDPRKPVEALALGRGVYQVMAMMAPYFRGDARVLFEKLAGQYLGE